MKPKINFLPSIGFLPIDNRPVSCQLPKILANLTTINSDFYLPPIMHLGSLNKQSDYNKITLWLNKIVNSIDYLILSVDTLAYGGLVFSRDPITHLNTAIERLSIIKKLKHHNPNLKIYVFSVILRDSITVRNNESFKTWAKMMQQNKQTPADIANFTDIRKRNLSINKLMIEWVEKHYIDLLVLCKEDTSKYSPYINEVHFLKREIKKLKVTKHVFLQNGTDEIPQLLLARLFCKHNHLIPKFYIYNFKSSDFDRIPIYESQPIRKTFAAQIKLIGGKIVKSPTENSLQVIVNFPKSPVSETLNYKPKYKTQNTEWKNDLFLLQIQRQENPGSQILIPNSQSAFNTTSDFTPHSAICNPQSAIRNHQIIKSPNYQITKLSNYQIIKSTLRNPQNVFLSILDIAYANGADPKFVETLLRKKLFFKLAAFSAWNTSANSMGTLLSQTALLWGVSSLISSLHTAETKCQASKEINRQTISVNSYPIYTRSVIANYSEAISPTNSYPIYTNKQILEFRKNLLNVQINLMFLRFIDDFLFQTMARSTLSKKLSNIWKINNKEQKIIKQEMQDIIAKYFAEFLKDSIITPLWDKNTETKITDYNLKSAKLPWNRLFEIAVDAEIKLKF